MIYSVRKIKKNICFAFLLFLCLTLDVHATEVHLDNTKDNAYIYGRLVNETYDKIILDSDISVSCFSGVDGSYAINSISNSSKTLDLNGYKMSLGCPLLLNGYNNNGIINIIDSSEEKTGQLLNNILIRNCFDGSCNAMTVNITGGLYNASTFIEFKEGYANNLNLNINNINFVGNTLFKGFSNNVNIRNSIFKPSDNNFKILDDESVVLLSDIIDENYKVIGNNDLITMTTKANDINIKDSNVYVAKNVDLIEINDFETKDKGYSQMNANYITLNNNSDTDIRIKNISIDNNNEFELHGTGELTVSSNSKLNTNYSVSVKDGLSVGKHSANIIVTDENDNLYVSTTTFTVETKKIPKPTITSLTTFEHDENNHEITFDGFDESAMELTGTTSSSQVGEYTATISLKDGYCWEDGTSDEIIYNWEIISVNQIDNLKIIGSNFINVNKQSQFQVIVLPDDATYKEVTWSVENGTGQATIDQNGLLTAVKTGTVKVKVVANYNNSIFAEKNIVINSEHSIERIMITAPSYYISSDSTHKLFASIYPTNIENKQVSWVSSDTSVATIDQTGLLTPIKEGNVTIKATATDGSEVYGEIELVIYNPTNTFTGIVGTTTKIEYSYTHSSHQVSSKDTTIATINGYSCDTSKYPYQCYANVYAVKPGSVTISAYPRYGTSADLDHNFTFLSYSAHTSINSSYNEIILQQNDVFLLDIDSLYEEDTKELYFTSSNDSVASIDSSGRIVAHNIGNSNITIFSKYNNKKLIIPLSVVEDKNNYTILSEDVTITGETNDLRVGKTFQYEASITPINTTNKNVTWSVENGTGQATIDENGLLTAVKSGTVKVKVTTQDGSNVSKSLDVTLKDYYDVEKIFIKNKDYYVETGKSFYMQALVFPDNATNKKVKWTSSNPTIATIDPDTGGLATNYKTGDVTITATATDGSGISGSIVLHVGYTNVKINETTSLGNSSYVTYDEVVWDISDTTIVQPTGQTNKTCITVGGTSNCKHSITVKGLKNGSTTVTMKTISGTILATSTVYVYTPMSGLSSDIDKLNLGENETKKVNMIITPNNVSSDLDKLIYTSSDESVAVVDQDGNVKGLKTGTANIVIYSQYNDISATIPVVVETYPSSVDINNIDINLNDENRTHQIEYTISPDTATNKKIIFTSEDSGIASVSENGLITALKNGTTKIIVKNANNEILKELSITITGLKTDITDFNVSGIEDVVYDGTEKKLNIKVDDGTYSLVENTDYEIIYENNLNVGKATLTIKGINYFKGTINLSFNINPATIEYTSLGKTVVYDGNSHEISLDVITEGVTIKYANQNGEYILNSMPKYSDAGIYEIKYELTKPNYITIKNSNLLTIEKADIKYSYTEREDYFDGYPSNLGYGNFSDLWISVSNPTKDYTIKYQDKNGNYTLDVADVPTKAGDKLINFQISAKNFNTIQSSMYRRSYGILNMHDSLRLTDWYLRVRDYTTDFNKLLNKFNVYSTNQYSFRYEHRDANNNVLVNSPIKTGDRFVMLFSGDLIFHDWSISILGDVNCDGKISALDYVKIKNHIMQTNYINSSWSMDAADLNEDGKISALDYVRVKNYIMNGGK